MLHTLLAILLPGGVAYFAAIGFLRPHGLPPWAHPLVTVLPYIVFGFGALYGWFVSSSRLVLSLLILALADRGILLFPPTDPDPTSVGSALWTFTSFLLPLNLLALSLVKDEALSTWRGLLRLVPVLAQPILVVCLFLGDLTDLARSLSYRTEWSPVPQPAMLAFLGATLLLGIRFACERNPLDAGTLWALIACWTALHGTRHGWNPTNFFSAAGLILFLTLVQASYRTAYRDSLTGLLGKQAYEEAVARLGTKYTLAIVGLDQLKAYGNQYGKAVSEQLLRLVAPKIQAAAAHGQVYRIAGEEFTILFPRRTATDTLAPLEAIRKEVEESGWHLRGSDRVWEGARLGAEALPLTASIGMVEAEGGHAMLGLVTKAAYRALYDAKGEGGNVIRRGNPIPPPPKPTRSDNGRIVAYSDMDF